MIVLYNKGLLYAKVIMNLKFKMTYNGRVFDNKKQEGILLLPEEVMHILQRNGDVKIWNGEKYIKLNLGQFYEIMQNKKYNVLDYVEPKKEVKVEPKKEEVKVEVKQAEPKKEEVKVEVKQEEKVQPKQEEKQEVKVEPKKEEVKVEVKQEEKVQPKQEAEPKKEYDNKKQRHNKQQGGDK